MLVHSYYYISALSHGERLLMVRQSSELMLLSMFVFGSIWIDSSGQL